MTRRHHWLAWLCLSWLVCAQSWAAAPFNAHILSAVQGMPVGGGYASDRAAEVRFACAGVVWQNGSRQLIVSPRAASPSFCSAACYMVLLRALSHWEAEQGRLIFPAGMWKSMRVLEKHPDGYLSWGRFNANGPGCAKWVHDLRAGINFTDPEAATSGDFLKLFFSPQIGVYERGHLVIFLDLVQRDGQTHIRYWSANKPGGYGVRTVPLASVHHLIFTRITHPERFSVTSSLPPNDAWLAAMLSRRFSFAEVCRECAVK